MIHNTNYMDADPDDEPSSYTIEPDVKGEGFWVCQYGVYSESSILAGQQYRQLCKHYDTVQAAQADYPGAEVADHQRYIPPTYIPKVPPPWFDELDAGEHWDEDY